MREIIVKARNKFIQKNNDILKQKLNNFEAKRLKKQELVQQSKIRQHISRSIKSVMKKVQAKQEIFNEEFENSMIKQLRSPNREFNLDDKYQEYINGKPFTKAKRQEKVKNYSQPKEIDKYANQNNPNAIRHRYHPSSKIFFTTPTEEEENSKFCQKNFFIILEIDPKYLEFIKNDIESFKLQIKTPNSLKDKENFLKFYSGGPSQTFDQPIFVSIILKQFY